MSAAGEALHTRLAATAKRLIDKHGWDGTLHPDGDSESPSSPWSANVDAGHDDDLDATIVILDFTEEEMEENKLIKRGDKKALIEASSGADLKDYTRIHSRVSEGELYQIMSFETIKPGNVTILYKAHVRRV